jgi:hypothetical protein
MITVDRRLEGAAWLSPRPVRDLAALSYVYPTLRQGLYQFLAGRPYRRVLLPDFVAEGVYDPFVRRGIDVRFYRVDRNLGVDNGEVAELVREWRPDVFVYIHYFGVYHEQSLAACRDVCAGRALFVEDFAHTLPQADIPLTGDVCLYSYPKTLGVAGGSLVWCNKRELLAPSPRSADTAADRELKRRLRRTLLVENLLSIWVRQRHCQTLVLRLTARVAGYYPFLCAAYPTLTAAPSDHTLAVLARVDFEAVAARRRQIATSYYGLIERRFLLELPVDWLQRQSLLGFPLLVDDQQAFHRHLLVRGVRGLTLRDRWWFRSDCPPGELFGRHYLLPLTHYMSDTQVRRVAAAVNAYRPDLHQ